MIIFETLAMTKIFLINILVLISLSGILQPVLPVLSIIYVGMNIRLQIEKNYNGDVKAYLKAMVSPLKKGKNGENNGNDK